MYEYIDEPFFIAKSLKKELVVYPLPLKVQGFSSNGDKYL